MFSLIFISQTCANNVNLNHQLNDIFTTATARNSMLDITGVLITSRHYFAQLLEGPIDSVTAVMSSITADPRHTSLRIVKEALIQTASCPNWQMARFDNVSYGNLVIDPLLKTVHADEGTRATRRLEHLIETIIISSLPIPKKILQQRGG